MSDSIVSILAKKAPKLPLRTVCRKAERIVVTLSKQQSINEFVIPYLNRLSDLFFTLARYVQHEMNTKEVTWSKTCGVRMIEVS